MIALTFDDGPNEPYTRQILGVLGEYGAKATFFVIGKWVRENPYVARDIDEADHEIGNHSDTHPSQPSIEEFCLCDGSLLDAGIEYAIHFRYPFGQVTQNCPLKHTGWDVHGGDWAAGSVESITEPIFKYLDANESGIVLLHDGYYKEFGADRSKTVEATRRILERYKGRKFVTIGEYQQCLTHCA